MRYFYFVVLHQTPSNNTKSRLIAKISASMWILFLNWELILLLLIALRYFNVLRMLIGKCALALLSVCIWFWGWTIYTLTRRLTCKHIQILVSWLISLNWWFFNATISYVLIIISLYFFPLFLNLIWIIYYFRLWLFSF